MLSVTGGLFVIILHDAACHATCQRHQQGISDIYTDGELDSTELNGKSEAQLLFVLAISATICD